VSERERKREMFKKKGARDFFDSKKETLKLKKMKRQIYICPLIKDFGDVCKIKLSL